MNTIELLKSKRTFRRYIQEKKIDESIINEMKESVRYISSAANLQPLRYIFVTSEEKVEELFPHTKWAARLPKELGTPKDGEKPVAYVVIYCAKNDFTPFTNYDVGLAMANLTTAAWAHGVGNCIFKSYTKDAIKSVCGLSNDDELCAVISFGYPSHKSTVVDIIDNDVAYSLDDNKDYIVPKRLIADIIKDI
ncbi:MAG: nitroreductase family protein [Eubacteriales bacterium]|nr:nitroreductase family protein [Eubacteriales bacterium]MDY3332769.1 nitroreductase family protein [Gallibacter sp.]